MKYVIEDIILELKATFNAQLKKPYLIVDVKDDNFYSLSSDHFVMTFDIEEAHFFISFKVGQTGENVASLTKIITMVLEPVEYTIVEDCFFSKEEGKLFFGYDALQAKQKEIHNSQGMAKCPICDKVFENKYIHENGICQFCDLNGITWN